MNDLCGLLNLQISGKNSFTRLHTVSDRGKMNSNDLIQYNRDLCSDRLELQVVLAHMIRFDSIRIAEIVERQLQIKAIKVDINRRRVLECPESLPDPWAESLTWFNLQ